MDAHGTTTRDDIYEYLLNCVFFKRIGKLVNDEHNAFESCAFATTLVVCRKTWYTCLLQHIKAFVHLSEQFTGY